MNNEKQKMKNKNLKMVVEYNCINKSHLGVKYMSNKTFGMHAATYDRVVLVFTGDKI